MSGWNLWSTLSTAQLVLSGDFCQLPPVPDRANGAQQPPTFAFDAKSWERCVGKPVVLTKVFRQKDQGWPNFTMDVTDTG